MYNKLEFKVSSNNKEITFEDFQINEEDSGNDFEKIVMKENKEFKEIIDFLACLESCIFSRMTGTGSCCYAVFEKKNDAIMANEVFKSNFKDLWSYVCENNTIIN